MSKILIKQFIIRPNKTELGMKKMNDNYILIPVEERAKLLKVLSNNAEKCMELLKNNPDKEYRETFSIEDYADHQIINFDLGITKNVILEGGKIKRPELRIYKLNDYYTKYNNKVGDEIHFTFIYLDIEIIKSYVRNIQKDRVRFSYSPKNDSYEINNLDLLNDYKDETDKYRINILDEKAPLEIQFNKKGAPRKGKNILLEDYYYVKQTGKKFPFNEFYLEKENNEFKFILNDSPKKLEQVEIDFTDLKDTKIEKSTKYFLDEEKISRQQIYYGAPGTGKSHKINEKTKENEVIRTTFHPDTDYSSFVGAYKPTTTNVVKYTSDGSELVDDNGNSVLEEKITYKFIPQSFLKAYISAWKKLAVVSDNATNNKVYLVIEEINRGNCAQIFGDLFQLLDRDDNGFSKYHIEADADIQKYLLKEFNGITIQNDILPTNTFQKVLNGEILLLPENLYIWATMNTSDQSLFPIDSAFKRRWDWEYVPIHNANKKWNIEIGDLNYDWWDFLEKINEKIETLTNSEDKKLGYFFCKAQNNVISEENFVGKVIFYLWNDVFKDYEFDDDVFKDEDGQKLVFNKFYSYNGTDTIIDEDKVQQFLSNLKVSKLFDTTSNDDEEVQPQEQTIEQTE